VRDFSCGGYPHLGVRYEIVRFAAKDRGQKRECRERIRGDASVVDVEKRLEWRRCPERGGKEPGGYAWLRRLTIKDCIDQLERVEIRLIDQPSHAPSPTPSPTGFIMVYHHSSLTNYSNYINPHTVFSAKLVELKCSPKVKNPVGDYPFSSHAFSSIAPNSKGFMEHSQRTVSLQLIFSTSTLFAQYSGDLAFKMEDSARGVPFSLQMGNFHHTICKCRNGQRPVFKARTKAQRILPWETIPCKSRISLLPQSVLFPRGTPLFSIFEPAQKRTEDCKVLEV
jgi:hypothetical protein